MTVRILIGGALTQLAALPDASVHCVVTSPPYWGLRSYTGEPGMIGLEETFDDHLANLVAVFREVRRVLRDDGTLWLNYGDAYAGGVPGREWKPKDLMMMPARVAMALQDDGWYLRSEIVWHKPNPMPESVTDRPTSAHEKVYLLAKKSRYYYDAEAVREPAKFGFRNQSKKWMSSAQNPGMNRSGGGSVTGACPESGRNLRNVWTIPPSPYSEAHFATFPPALVEPCIKAGCPAGGTVLDPFGGAGTTGLVADRLQRNAILVEISPEYADMARRRIEGDAPMFADVLA